MREAFPNAETEGYEHRIESLHNDPGDRHVLAAAIQASVGVIITANHRDFPESALRPYDIVAQTPDEFLMHLFQASPN
jgi:hypothetical protein